MSLKVIKPTTFAAGHLLSTTAVETCADWAAGTTYAKGAVVHADTSLYEALGPTTGNPPATSPLQWLRTGPDNRTAAFDTEVSTTTTASGSLSMSLAPGMVNSLALVNLSGNSCTVTVKDGATGPTVYSRTLNLDGTIISDWYQYFFEPYVQKKELTITDLPPYANSVITISVTGSGTVGVGNVVYGTTYDLGDVLKGVSLGTDDYSAVTTDEFGVTTLTRRNSSKVEELQMLVPRGQMRKVFQVLDELRATPCVWVPSSREEDSPLSLYGIRSSFRIVVEYATHVSCSLTLKGMT